MTDEPAEPKPGISKGSFYRLSRDWHGYLSAFAFLALIFFSATGILLNHPGLLQGAPPPPLEQAFRLEPAQIAEVKAAAVPGEALARIAASKFDLAGVYREGEIAGDDVFVRLQGVRGFTDLRANLVSGDATVYVERETAVGVMNALHRGEHAGTVWRLFLDVMAGLFIVMSLIGFILFLSMRFRLRTALVLAVTSLIVMAGLFVFAAA